MLQKCAEVHLSNVSLSLKGDSSHTLEHPFMAVLDGGSLAMDHVQLRYDSLGREYYIPKTPKYPLDIRLKNHSKLKFSNYAQLDLKLSLANNDYEIEQGADLYKKLLIDYDAHSEIRMNYSDLKWARLVKR